MEGMQGIFRLALEDWSIRHDFAAHDRFRLSLGNHLFLLHEVTNMVPRKSTLLPILQ